MTFKKGKKNGSSSRRSSVESFWLEHRGMDGTSQYWLPPQLRKPVGVWKNPLAFWAFFNKAWIWQAHSLSHAWETLLHKQQANNWKLLRRVCACNLGQFGCFHIYTHTQMCRLSVRVRQLHTLISTPAEVHTGQIVEDVWWNHQSRQPPSGQIKFVLVWPKRNGSRAETAPPTHHPRPPTGGRGARGTPGFFTTSEGTHQSHGRWTDRRWLARRLELREAGMCEAFHWWQIFLVFGPTRQQNQTQLEVWRAHCSNCICLCKINLWKKTGLLPQYFGWHLIKMTLASYER